MAGYLFFASLDETVSSFDDIRFSSILTREKLINDLTFLQAAPLLPNTVIIKCILTKLYFAISWFNTNRILILHLN